MCVCMINSDSQCEWPFDVPVIATHVFFRTRITAVGILCHGVQLIRFSMIITFW